MSSTGWKCKENGATEFGDRLKKERKRRQIGLLQFAQLVGVSVTQIAAVENRGSMPHVNTLISISKVLDCSTDWLLGLEE